MTGITALTVRPRTGRGPAELTFPLPVRWRFGSSVVVRRCPTLFPSYPGPLPAARQTPPLGGRRRPRHEVWVRPRARLGRGFLPWPAPLLPRPRTGRATERGRLSQSTEEEGRSYLAVVAPGLPDFGTACQQVGSLIHFLTSRHLGEAGLGDLGRDSGLGHPRRGAGPESVQRRGDRIRAASTLLHNGRPYCGREDRHPYELFPVEGERMDGLGTSRWRRCRPIWAPTSRPTTGTVRTARPRHGGAGAGSSLQEGDLEAPEPEDVNQERGEPRSLKR